MTTEKERIEKIIESEGLSSSQFASEIGISIPNMSHIISGRNKPSLDVLKKILERFKTISSDWLILGIGPMYREIRQSQTLKLFDEEPETIEKSDKYNEKIIEKTSVSKNTIQSESLNPKQEIQNIAPIIAKSVKVVKKIIIYFDDNTFQEFDAK